MCEGLQKICKYAVVNDDMYAVVNDVKWLNI